MPQCLISLGSNKGDRTAQLRRAVDAIIADPMVQSIRCSRLFETPPIGGPDAQGTFLNATAVIDTDHSTNSALDLLQRTELQLGRQRLQRWDERTIDLDLVLYGTFHGSTLRLELPHPRYAARNFVLQPAIDVAPDWKDPRFGWTLRDLHDHLMRTVPSLALSGGSPELRTKLCQDVASGGAVTFRDASTSDQPQGPWISDFVPSADPDVSLLQASHDPKLPRLIVRLHDSNQESVWPSAPTLHYSERTWPEYRVDAADPSWAGHELSAAIDSMQCPMTAVTDDGQWCD